jgi:hypothetical protein
MYAQSKNNNSLNQPTLGELNRSWSQKSIYVPFPFIQVDFITAVSICRSHGLEVVTFADDQEQQAISNFVLDTEFPTMGTSFSSSFRFWTGAIRHYSKNYFWFSHSGPTNFLNIDYQGSPPSGILHKRNCLAMVPSWSGDRGVMLLPSTCSGMPANVICEGFN